MFLFVDPWPQDPCYHKFADDRPWGGLPNALNVLSNLGLLLVGAWGTVLALRLPGCSESLRWPYRVFFLGVFLTAFGSAWYHHDPNNTTLVWDRLPMTLMFMGFLTIGIGELISRRFALLLLPPLIVAGLLSVIYWILTETAGAGDLRPYGLAQFLPPLLVVIMLIAYPRPPGLLGAMIGLLVFFVLAKAFEHYDSEVYLALDEVVSGHTIKHLCAAIAPAFLIPVLSRKLSRRNPPEG